MSDLLILWPAMASNNTALSCLVMLSPSNQHMCIQVSPPVPSPGRTLPAAGMDAVHELSAALDSGDVAALRSAIYTAVQSLAAADYCDPCIAKVGPLTFHICCFVCISGFVLSSG